MIRPRHRFVALCFALLLVSMQYGAQLHALEHVRDSLRHTPDHSLTAPAADPCALCALFAGGASAATGASATAAVAPDARVTVSAPPASPAASAPSYYRSRAPPVLL